MNFETMNKQRKMILIAAAVGVIAMFLPWVSVFGFSVNGMQGWGVLVFLCFLGAGALSLLGDQTKNLEKNNWMFTLLAGGIASVIMLVYLINAAGSLGYLSIGFYGAFIASVGIVVLAYMHRSAGDTIQEGYDALRNRFTDKSNLSETNGSSTRVINTTTDSSKPVV